MTSQEEALVFLARLLEQHQFDYMVIGGLANAVWDEPRGTKGWICTTSRPESKN